MGLGKLPFETSELVILVGWILKDLGWVSLCAYVAWPAALAALVVEVRYLASKWQGTTWGLRVHGCAEVCWMLGNAAWMVSEFMFDPERQPGRRMPWFTGPMLGASRESYAMSVVASRVCLGAGLGMLLAFYGLCMMGALPWASSAAERIRLSSRGTEPSDEDHGLVFGRIPRELYAHMFIGPWIAKDLAWTLELKLPILLFGLITAALILDCLRRFGGEVFMAELLWVGGNCAWVWCEVWQQDLARWPRCLAAFLLCWSAALLSAGLARTHLSMSAAGSEKRRLLTPPSLPVGIL